MGRTKPYKSLPIPQITEKTLTHRVKYGRGAEHLFWIGRLSLTRAACILALSEQREAEKPAPEKAALANACRQWQTSEAQLSHRSRKSAFFLSGHTSPYFCQGKKKRESRNSVIKNI